MAHIISVDFTKNNLVAFKELTVQSDKKPETLAQYMVELLIEYDIHFWDNEHKSIIQLSDAECDNFSKYVSKLHRKINNIYYKIIDNEYLEKDIKQLEKIKNKDFKSIICWFSELNIPFLTATIEDIGKYRA